ncbi:hypothetical protein [Paracoccus benzoatiresistens]|uniref:Uncharacterized protein n=1 Tax=Paracoccus benzoatiresistens TaxID=2997341 RepID=A0ABT4J5Q3_9RHOB|nr:hypothetical protein [Paracoccus sp. EF6]MCZ0962460.1 hypothetical protein [Paracoccus sp. EF6]
MTITLETITELRDTLARLPEKPRTMLTARDAVAALAPEIHAARSGGYGLADIAAMLQQRGIRVSPSTLGSYLRELAPSSAKARTPRGRSVSS